MTAEQVASSVGVQRMMIGHFVQGIIHVCAQPREDGFAFTVHDVQLHRGFAAAYDDLSHNAVTHNVDPRFTFKIESGRETSPSLETALADLLYLRRPTTEGIHGSYVHLLYHADNSIADGLFNSLPGSPELYRHLADIALEVYDHPKSQAILLGAKAG